MNRSALKSYGTQQVMSSSPAKLVALLFDKAIVSLREAIHAIEQGKVNDRWKANNRATSIITHLANTLDYDKGGEVAANLDQLYRFMLERLFQVDVQNDPQPAREVIGLLEPLRDAWHELAARQADGSLPAAQAQASGQVSGQAPGQAPRPAQPAAGGYGAARPNDGGQPATSRPLMESLNLSA